MNRILILFSLFVSFLQLRGQDIQFSHINTTENLSHVSVVTLYADENDYIWIGTRDGLNRYDGLNIETYKLEEDNANSLFSNDIKVITGDKKGSLFILCTEGVSHYNMAQNKFTTLWQDSHIRSIYCGEDLYVGRNRNIFVFDQATEKFILKHTLPNHVSSITSLFVDSTTQTLFAGTDIGLFSINKQGKITHEITIHSAVSNIYKDDDGDMWISSWNDGVFLMSKGDVKQFVHKQNDDNSIASNFVRGCCQDNRGNIWMATFAGLNKYNKKTGQITFTPSNKRPDGLSHSSVWCVIKDHQGSIWLGTYFGGVNYFNPDYSIYTHYEEALNEKDGLSSSIVGRMTEDGNHNLWICTEGAGVNMFDRKNETFKWYLPKNGVNSIAHNNVKAIYYDEQENAMWFGVYLGGLDKLDLKTGRFTHYMHKVNDPKSIPSNNVRQIVPYDRQLIIATDNGVGVFDIATQKCEMLLADSVQNTLLRNTLALHIDQEENLWVSVMGEGIYRYNFSTKELVNYRHNPNDHNSLSNNNINSIMGDSHNILYFCTAGRGLDVFDYKTNTFTNYDSKKNNLINDFLYNIIEAGPDDYLITTNLGLSRFNPSTGSFRNYNKDNNFPLSIINDHGLYLTNDRRVFLGGVDGMVSFDLDSFNFTPRDYDIRLSRLYVNNNEVHVNDKTKILSEALFKTSGIILDAKSNIFEIDVTTTNYITANAEGLYYQLKGFSDEWIPLRGNKITYTNLDAGKYTLIVKSTDENQSNVGTLSLDIEVQPPFYRSTLAYILYFIVLVLLITYLFRIYDKSIKLQASLSYEQKHLEDVKALNQSKLRFFTNISHEFRTPLTVIIGQLDYLINKHSFTSDVYDKILSAYKNSIQMRDLISELLDFRKQEQGHMTITASEHDVVSFVKENFFLFEEFAKTKSIQFLLSTDIDSLNLWYDEKQLQKVMNNLISNAFKHTPTHGTIKLNLEANDKECIISVADSGNGIAEEDLDKIFERFYQIDNQMDAGSGIGLALSKGIVTLHGGQLGVESGLGKGATFRIVLPLGKSHLAPEFVDNSTDQKQKIENETIEVIGHFRHKAIASAENENKGLKILVVEDNTDLRNVLIDVFSDIYTVVSASDGKQGLEMVYAEQPDIILSDIVMPNMTGIELCKAVKSDINICHIPLILLTAKTSVEHNMEGLGIGADDYITKPFDVEILLSRCENLITSRRLLQQVFSSQPEMRVIQLAANDLDRELLEKATNIVEENLDNIDFTINDFHKEMGMSRTNLFTKMKALTGQTPNAFINTIRLQKAAYLLKTRPDLNISDISIITGFNTSHYFSKCFKDIYKKTPTEYREVQ